MNLNARVDRLEGAANASRKRAFTFKEKDETAEEAIARHIAARPEDAAATFTVYHWME